MKSDLQASIQTHVNNSIVPTYNEHAQNILNGDGSFNDVRAMFECADFRNAVSKLERHDLLPSLFKIRNEPYSIVDYPQFAPMYAKDAPATLVYLCGRQIAKTTNLSRSEIYDMVTIPNYQVLYVAPLQSQAHRYGALYLYETITSCELAVAMQTTGVADGFGEGPVIKSIAHQAFSNGAGVQLMYAKVSADRARGVTADRIDFDEVQDQLVDNIPVIEEASTNSAWDIKRFTGTAKTTDNTIEHYWQKSSQAEWAVKCPACNHWNIPSKDHDILGMIDVIGPVCAKCNKKGIKTRLNVREGKFVHAIPSRANDYMGVHVPQIVVPAITEDPRKWDKLIRKVANLPESLMYMEVLGISHDSGSRLLTRQDIEDASVLDTPEVLRDRLADYSFRVVGVDWGVAEITSFTVATVVGYTPSGDFHVIYAKRYIGVDMEHILQDVMRIYNSYSCDMIAGDYGAGFTNNSILLHRGAMLSQISYVRSNTFMKYTASNGVPKWSVDRNTAISAVFLSIKYKRILFPRYDTMSDYTRDLLSVYEEEIDSSSGIKNKVFRRDPASPDDFCHALVFAVVMLIQLTKCDLLDLIPMHSFDYTENNFPLPDQNDIETVLQNLAAM